LVRASCIRLNRLLAWPAVRIILAVVFEICFSSYVFTDLMLVDLFWPEFLLMIMNYVAD